MLSLRTAQKLAIILQGYIEAIDQLCPYCDLNFKELPCECKEDLQEAQVSEKLFWELIEEINPSIKQPH